MASRRACCKFVGTLALADPSVQRGYIVTTSYFSRDAQRLLAKKGPRVAEIELLDGAQLWAKLKTLASSDVPAYFVDRDSVAVSTPPLAAYSSSSSKRSRSTRRRR